MSKAKKKTRNSSTTISESDIKFVKSIEFAGWIFLLALGIFMGTWFSFDYLPDLIKRELKINVDFLNLIDLELNAVYFSFIIVMGTLGPFCFALSNKINKNLDKKREILIDWITAVLLFNVFALIAIAAYQW